MVRFFLQDWKLKLLAVGIALVLWVLVVGQDHAETSLDIPVVMVNMPPKMLILGDVPSEVLVRVSGPRILVGQASGDDKQRMVINLEGMKAGEHIFQLTPDKLKLPPNVRISRISPASFKMTLAPRQSREVQVRPVLKGDPAPGFEIDEIIFEPREVTVHGVEQDLEALDWIWTVPLEVSGIDETENFEAVLNLPDGRSLSLAQPTVQATIKVRSLPSTEEPKNPEEAKAEQEAEAEADQEVQQEVDQADEVEPEATDEESTPGGAAPPQAPEGSAS